MSGMQQIDIGGRKYRYRWDAPSEEIPVGEFTFIDNQEGSVYMIKPEYEDIMITESATATDLQNSTGLGATTLEFSDIPIGSLFGWNHRIRAWVYQVGKNKYVKKGGDLENIIARATSQSGGNTDMHPVDIDGLWNITGYKWIPPSAGNIGMFVFGDSTGNKYEIKLEDTDILEATYSVAPDDFADSTQDGKTTLKLKEFWQPEYQRMAVIPLGSHFGWNYDMKEWIYRVGEHTFSKEWDEEAIIERLADKIRSQKGGRREHMFKGVVKKEWWPIPDNYVKSSRFINWENPYYTWEPPGRNSLYGMFRFTDTYSTQAKTSAGQQNVHGMKQDHTELIPDDIMKDTFKTTKVEFSKSIGRGKTTLKLDGIPEGSTFGWNHDMNAWVYKVGSLSPKYYYKKWNADAVLNREIVHDPWIAMQSGGFPQPHSIGRLPNITYYQWIPPKGTSLGMFVFYDNQGNKYNIEVEPDDIGNTTARATTADYYASTQDGKTTLDLSDIPKDSAFGWNYNMNSWVYKINPKKYVSKPLCGVENYGSPKAGCSNPNYLVDRLIKRVKSTEQT